MTTLMHVRTPIDENVPLEDDNQFNDKDSAFSIDFSTGTHGSGHMTVASNASSCEVRDLQQSESKQVDMWRDLLTGAMLIMACFLSVGSFIYLSLDETQNFKNVYDQYLLGIEGSAARLDTDLLNSLTSVSDQITSFAQNSDLSSFPYITLPFWEQNVHKARQGSSAKLDSLSFCPLVRREVREEWEAYAQDNQWWAIGNQTDSYSRQEKQQLVAKLGAQTIPRRIFRLDIDDDTDGNTTTELGSGPYTPRWQTSPSPEDTVGTSHVNYDVRSSSGFLSLFSAMAATKSPVISEVFQANMTNSYDFYAPTTANESSNNASDLVSLLFHPITETFEQNSAIVGLLEVSLNWKTLLSNLLPNGESGVYYVLSNSCGDMHSYELRGGEIHCLGPGNHHDIYYSHLEAQISFLGNYTSHSHLRPCVYSLTVYPSAELRQSLNSNAPEVFTATIASVFFVMGFFFLAYDRYVARRNRRLLQQAIKTNEIVASFFPKNIRARLLNDENDKESTDGKPKRKSNLLWGGGLRLKTLLNGSSDGNDTVRRGETDMDGGPIADLFPSCTVLFADIVGFTAWSSMREPTQVLLLLESIYCTFDDIAKRRKVFKVETIGDCYVAVTGLPEPNKQHALIMAKFAREIMFQFHEVTKGLEVSLGPDTGDLSMRFGLHSGPVTAGVLRGERSRFQLFGDTVNTASRIETTGRPGCIHMSKEAAQEIVRSGKKSWIRERADKVTAKGKGELTTFWLSLEEASSGADPSRIDCLNASMDFSLLAASNNDKSLSYFSLRRADDNESERERRLIEWNVDILHRLLGQIAAKREALQTMATPRPRRSLSRTVSHDATEDKHDMVLEEVSEVIRLPNFTPKVAAVIAQAEEIDVSEQVVEQLRDFVTKLAGMYHRNPFHNFEHASHVTMSVVKLLSRIVAPTDLDVDLDNGLSNEALLMNTIASKMHDHTYGITSDPLTQFAVTLAALIHDVDHLGVPNSQLVKEETATAVRYKGQSVAEQNSVDLAWAQLMKPEYEQLRAAIGETKTEWSRFRQLVVNSVMATDIVDKELKELRNARWDKAFSGEFVEEDSDVDRNRKATIVIEHLIQASDISHTMQHWHIYRKWNERLFRELYRAFKQGRAEKDPSEFWFKGEIGFFTFYIIPLAKKLKDCGVFGVSSDEYLNYAEQNLSEWKTKGQQVVAEMVENVKAEYAYLDHIKRLSLSGSGDEARRRALRMSMSGSGEEARRRGLRESATMDNRRRRGR